MKQFIALIFIAALPFAANAHGNVFELTQMAVESTLENFTSNESASTVRAYKGLRSWPSGSKIKVRVYVGDTESILYSCELVHPEGAPEYMGCEK